MNKSDEAIATTIKKYSSDLPWGIYLYDISENELSHWGGQPQAGEYHQTEKYLADMIKDICFMAVEKQKVYTETSPSGLVYISVPLFIDKKIWAVLATYLSLGKEGTWRRTLNRGPSVTRTVDLLEELGFILSTHQEVQKWYRPSFQDESEKSPSPENEDRLVSPKLSSFARW
ncbi:MAG TPA: hypothetical protein ENO22_00245 [candidate division Zixibacteria bacterium]|nr:hypothetical protein [candidate division Zixibacteria bacterium]HEQ97756.1 hypothetical protein [candidate division Zixibacteria bacterium]